MLLNKERMTITIVLWAMFFTACIGQYTMSYASDAIEMVRDQYRDLVSVLQTDSNHQTQQLLKQWSIYVAEITTFKKSDFLVAINSMQRQYYEKIQALESCVVKTKENKANYSSAWLEDLIDQFGKAYVKMNEKAILTAISAVVFSFDEKCCAEISSDIVYSEAILYATYKRYLNLFIKFFEKLDTDAQKKLKSRFDAAKSFLDLIENTSMTHILTEMKIEKLLEVKALRQDKAVYHFLIKHPSAKYLDLMKAKNDLFKITRGK